MKKILACCALLSSSLGFLCADDYCMNPCEVQDNFGYYVALGGGPQWHGSHAFTITTGGTDTRKYHLGYSVNGSFGVKFYEYCVRAEIEALYRRNSLKSITTETGSLGKLSAKGKAEDAAVMFNVFKDFIFNDDFEAYFGAGVGMAFNKLRVIEVDGVSKYSPSSKNVFAWNLLAGGVFNVNNRLALTVGYRLFSTTKVRDAKKAKSHRLPLSHSIDMGIRVYL